MAKDKHGKDLHVGDMVNIACKVESVTESDELSNVALVTIEPLYPTTAPTSIVLNGKQVEMVMRMQQGGKSP